MESGHSRMLELGFPTIRKKGTGKSIYMHIFYLSRLMGSGHSRMLELGFPTIRKKGTRKSIYTCILFVTPHGI